MDSACHIDHLLVHVSFVHIVSDAQYVTCIIVDSFAQLLYSETVLKRWCLISLLLKQINVVLEVLIGVWLEIGEIGYVVVMLEGIAERERVEIGALRFFIFVNVAGDVILIIVIVRL